MRKNKIKIKERLYQQWNLNLFVDVDSFDVNPNVKLTVLTFYTIRSICRKLIMYVYAGKLSAGPTPHCKSELEDE